MDLVKARKMRVGDLSKVMTDISVDGVIHALLHFQNNRIITLCKYKETVKSLSDMGKLQPFFHLERSVEYTSFSITDLRDMLRDNSNMPYYIKIDSDNPMTRWSSERKIKVFGMQKSSHLDTFNEPSALDISQVIELRLKAAALDAVYDHVNWTRSSMNSDIFLEDRIYERRYQQAVSYLDDETAEAGLLEIYAQELDCDIKAAAKHVIFCYEEDSMSLEMSERMKSQVVRKIKSAESLEEIQDLMLAWIKQSRTVL